MSIHINLGMLVTNREVNVLYISRHIQDSASIRRRRDSLRYLLRLLKSRSLLLLLSSACSRLLAIPVPATPIPSVLRRRIDEGESPEGEQ